MFISCVFFLSSIHRQVQLESLHKQQQQCGHLKSLLAEEHLLVRVLPTNRLWRGCDLEQISSAAQDKFSFNLHYVEKIQKIFINIINKVGFYSWITFVVVLTLWAMIIYATDINRAIFHLQEWRYVTAVHHFNEGEWEHLLNWTELV